MYSTNQTRNLFRQVEGVRPEAIFFDLGKVLLDFDWTRAIPRFACHANRDYERVKQFIAAPLHIEFELGMVTPPDFYRAGVDAMGFRGSFDEFKSIWCEIFSEIFPLIDVAKRLALEYPLYLISNTNVLHVEYVERQYDVFSIFEQRFYSCQMKLRKPDPRVFEIALSASKCERRQALLVDDRIENVESARACGLQTLHVTSPDAAANELRHLL